MAGFAEGGRVGSGWVGLYVPRKPAMWKHGFSSTPLMP